MRNPVGKTGRLLRQLVLAAVLGAVFAPAVAAQGAGALRGTLIDTQTGQPLAGANVQLQGTEFASITNPQGQFLIVNLPAGTYTVVARTIGYAEAETTVEIEAGETESTIIRLQPEALRLDELIVTGVAGATEREKVPFTVDQVTAEDLPVPAMSAAASLQGKVAGARVVSGSGQPGEEPDILLRGATSINAAGRSQAPLIIIDGMPTAGGMADIPAEDIESIEVVKGAAAASLYGARAGNGVIQITTKRGPSDVGTRYTLRTEYGQSSLSGSSVDLSNAHPWRMNEAGTRFFCETATGACAGGVEFDYFDTQYTLQLAGDDVWSTFMDQGYPGVQRDHIESFFNPGEHLQTSVSAAGRTGDTRFYLSGTFLDSEGVIRNHGGFDRRSLRLNVDHGFTGNLQLSGTGFYSRSSQAEIGSGTGGPFFELTFMPPHVDLLARDSTGELLIQPDPREEYANPLYEVENREVQDEQSRFMGGLELRYSPVTWFDLEGAVSYDRTDWDRTDYFPKGYQTLDPSALNFGSIENEASLTSALNTSVTGRITRAFGDLNTRVQARYSYEAQHDEGFDASGGRFVVQGVQDLDVAERGSESIGSYREDIRSAGAFLITALDYKDRYVADALIRRDGSSLFGADERWQTYYRGSLAWLFGREPWLEVPFITDGSVHYSVGTAGGRPRFSAQYETYTLNQGSLSPGTLGNRDLKPEFITEHEAGIDLTIAERARASVVYANSTAEDQILQVPLAGYAGFATQWRNAGTLESQTWEASLQIDMLRRDGFSWSTRLLYDRTNTEVTELDVPCYTTGVNHQNLEGLFYICDDTEYGSIWGRRFASDCGDLPSGVSCNAFSKSDDGYLVFVGEGNTARSGVGPDGLAGTGDDLWGSTGTIEGTTYQWGVPFIAAGESGEPDVFQQLGSTQPDFSLSIGNTFQIGGLNLHALFDGSFGQDVYNITRQWAMYRDRAGEGDQIGKAEGDKKPIGYYGALYDGLKINSHFIEDGSFVKLREVAASYSFGRDQVERLLPIGADGITLSLIGRNLFTWTDYTGFDPEVGRSGDDGGSSAVNRLDAYGYPNFRTITASVQLIF